MNKKIKIIDLMQKCANKENIPEKILYKNTAFVLNDCKCYYNEEKDERLLDYIIPTFSNLNDEVEILEDNTEEINIQEIEEIDEYLYQGSDLPNVKDGHCIKTNELIRAIKQLDRVVNKLRKDKSND